MSSLGPCMFKFIKKRPTTLLTASYGSDPTPIRLIVALVIMGVSGVINCTYRDSVESLTFFAVKIRKTIPNIGLHKVSILNY